MEKWSFRNFTEYFYNSMKLKIWGRMNWLTWMSVTTSDVTYFCLMFHIITKNPSKILVYNFVNAFIIILERLTKIFKNICGSVFLLKHRIWKGIWLGKIQLGYFRLNPCDFRGWIFPYFFQLHNLIWWYDRSLLIKNKDTCQTSSFCVLNRLRYAL